MNKIIPAFSIGIILQWLSLFFSYQKLPEVYQDTNKVIATGGFPIKIFDYPVPPLGSDWPPADTWPIFFLNLATWLTVGFAVALLLRKYFENNRVIQSLGILAVALSVIGLFYIVINFD